MKKDYDRIGIIGHRTRRPILEPRKSARPNNNLPEFEVGGIVVTAGGVGKVEVSGVFAPQLTLEELRDQFEEFYVNQNGSTHRRDLISISTKGNYGFHKAQIMWLSYKECAKANNILREG